MGFKQSEDDNQMNQTSRQKTKTRWINEPRAKQRMNNRTTMMERRSMTKKDGERASSETELFTNVLTQSIQGTSRTLRVGETYCGLFEFFLNSSNEELFAFTF